MAENTMIFAQMGLGVETLAAPGAAVAATKVLTSVKSTVQPNPDVKTFTPTGFLFPTAATLIKETTNVKIDGAMSYNEGNYLLASTLTDPVITTPGGGTLSRLWTYSLVNNSPNSQRSYSLEYGSSVRAVHCQNAIQTEMGLTFNRKDFVKVAGAMVALPVQDDKVRWLRITGSPASGTFTITVGASTTSAIQYNASAATIQAALAALPSVGSGNVTCTGGPVNTAPVRIVFGGTFAKAAVPAISTTDTFTGGTSPASAVARLSFGTTQLTPVLVSPTTIDIKVATSQAGLGAASALTRDFEYSWKVSNRDAAFFPLNSGTGAGFAGMTEAQPKGESTLGVAASDESMGLLGNLRAGDTIFVRASATGPLIEGSLYHTLQIDTALKLTKISEFKDIDGGLMGVTFSGDWCHDPTWGYATVAQLQNTLTAL